MCIIKKKMFILFYIILLYKNLIYSSNLQKPYHFLIVLLETHLMDLVSKNKTSRVTNDVIGKFGEFWRFRGNFWVPSGPKLTNKPILVIYSLSSFQWDSWKWFLKTFWKSCSRGFILKNDVTGKLPQKGSKYFPIECAFFLVTLETLRDLCAKFQPHTIFFKVKP